MAAASVATSEAVYPAPAALMALTTPAGVSFPEETLIVEAVPDPGVIVKVKAPPLFSA